MSGFLVIDRLVYGHFRLSRDAHMRDGEISPNRTQCQGFHARCCSNSAAAEAQKGLYLRSYPYRRYNKLILVSF